MKLFPALASVRPCMLAVLALCLGSGSLAGQESLAERQLRSLASREQAILAQADQGIDPADLQSQLQQLVREYDLLIQSSPQFTPAFVAYAQLLRKTGQDKAALAMFFHANRLDPNLAVVKNGIGNYLIEEAKYREALTYYSAASALAPNEPLYHFQIGNLLYEFRDHLVADKTFSAAEIESRMLESFRRAAELDPDRIPFAYRYAEAFYDLEVPQWEEALRQWRLLKERVAQGVERQTIQLHEANVLIQQERFDEARPLLEEVTAPALEGNRKTLVDMLPENQEK